MANSTHADFLGRSALGTKPACPPRRSSRVQSPTPKPPRRDSGQGGPSGPPRGFILAALILAGLFVVGVLVWPKSDRKNEQNPRQNEGESPSVAGPGFAPIGFFVATGSASLRGTVTEDNGVALATATVCARQMSDSTGEDSTMTPRCTMVGVDGKYALADLAPGRWMVSATAPGHLPGVHSFAGGMRETFLGAQDARTDVNIALQLGGARLEGHVVDAEGVAIVGATVTIESGLADLVVTSDEQGAFTADVGSGLASISAEHPGYADSLAEGVAPTSMRIVMLRETVLAGRVIDAATQLPVAGARVRPGGSDEVSWASNAESALTDADGRFRIEGLTSGRYRPSAEAIGAKGAVGESFVVGVGESVEDLLITVTPARHVRGRPMLDGKTACKDGWVSLVEKGTDANTDWRRVDADGSVFFPAVDDGTYEVSVECEGIESNPKEPLVVTRDLDDVVWPVMRGLAIKGVLVDADGRPVAGAFLRVGPREPGPDGPSTSGYAESASDGSFTIAGLQAATYELTLTSDQHASPLEALVVTVPPDRDVEGVRVTLPRGGTIEGIVVDTAGKPMAAVRVEAAGAGHYAMTDPQGKFRIPALTPSIAHLALETDRGRRLIATDGVKEIDIRDGKTTFTRIVVKRPDGFVSGRVVDGDGKPIAGALVDADVGDFGPRLTILSPETAVMTDAQGRFLILGLGEGPFSLRARGGAKEARLSGVASGSDVVLRAAVGATVEGAVAFADGHVPPRFTVTIGCATTSLREEFVGTNGRFTFRGIVSGEALISVSAAESHGEATATVSNAGAHSVSIVLSAFRKVIGRVVDEQGHPVPNADVVVESASAETTTGVDGRFELTDVFGDKLAMQAFRNDPPYARANASQTMDPSSSATIDVGDLVLHPGEVSNDDVPSDDVPNKEPTVESPSLSEGVDDLPPEGASEGDQIIEK
jgi:protocatechuate 3,4-dioxygenase beta subunit